ncbi:polysaccharide deacetylase family protein, partial [Myxococcota bacterium]|nr:polysaccharide deacetylase family protein [Myxococcota bacterium]
APLPEPDHAEGDTSMKRSRKTIRVLVSVDTEEDNWAATRKTATVENIRALPKAHESMTALGLRPTYFVNYPVVSTDWSGDIIRTLHCSGRCEVGAHLHPWNTPPLEESFTPENTMMKNLPAKLQRKKLQVLTQAIANVTGQRPTSFRAGRFGLDEAGVRALVELGYQVDSSVTPFVNWMEYSEGADFSRAPFVQYRMDGRSEMTKPSRECPIWEVPISCGFTRRPFAWRGRLHRILENRRLRPFKLLGVASRTGVLRRVVGSPETDSIDDLVQLAHSLIQSDVNYLHLFFHSSSLVPGNSPFVRTEKEALGLMKCLAEFVSRVADVVDLESATVGELVEARG